MLRLYGRNLFKTTSARAARMWRDIKYINLFFDRSLVSWARTYIYTLVNVKKKKLTHWHMHIGFELWNVWNLVTQLHNDSAMGHLERPLAVRRGHGCEKRWSSRTCAKIFRSLHIHGDAVVLPCFTSLNESDTRILRFIKPPVTSKISFELQKFIQTKPLEGILVLLSRILGDRS